MAKDVIIIGAGFAGIYLAYRMKRYNITILEKNGRFGGFLDAVAFRNEEIDKYYHTFFKKDVHLMNLLRELDLTSHILQKRMSKSIFYRQKLYNVTSLSDLVGSSAFSLKEKVFLTIAHALILLLPDRKCDSINAQVFFKRILGIKLYQQSWKLIISTKYKNFNEPISLLYIKKRLQRTAGKSVFSINKPFKIILDKMLEHTAVRLLKKIDIRRIIKNGEKYIVESADENFTADIVISTIPFPELARYYSLPFDYEFQSTGVICAVIITDKEVVPYFWNTIMDREFQSCVFLNMTGAKPFISGLNLNYMSMYDKDSSDLFSYGTNALKDIFKRELRKLNPDILDENILFMDIARYEYGQPIWKPDFQKKQARYFAVANNFFAVEQHLTYPNDRSLDAVIKMCDSLLNSIRM